MGVESVRLTEREPPLEEKKGFPDIQVLEVVVCGFNCEDEHLSRSLY